MAKATYRADPRTLRLHFAVRADNEEAVRSLLSQHVEVDALDTMGYTALHLACTDGNSKIAELLLEKGARVDFALEPAMNVPDPEIEMRGFQPIHLAALSGDEETVKLLLRFHADVNAVDAEGRPALHVACETGFSNIVALLLENGASINLACTVGWDKGRSALHIAATRESNEEVAAVLLENSDIDVDAADPTGWTALHVACLSERPKMIAQLLKSGADPNLTCVERSRGKGFTPLHLVSFSRKSEAVDLLLEWGADINLTNEDGHTPLDCASELRVLRGSPLPHGFEIVDDIRRHAMKLKVANLFVSQSNLKSLDDDDEMELFRCECEKEIKSMRGKKLGQSKVSYFDILTKTDNQVADYAENEDIVNVMKSDVCGKEFPIFARLIHGKFNRGVLRANLLRGSAEGLHFAINKLIKFPYVCVNKINRNLTNTVLMNVLRAKLTCASTGNTAAASVLEIGCEIAEHMKIC